VRTYQVYGPSGQLLADTDAAAHALRRVVGTKNAYLVTDKQGPREPTTVRSVRHDTWGVLNKDSCTRIYAAVGPREVGIRVRRAPFGTVERIRHIDVGWCSRLPGSVWSITVVEQDGTRRVHSEAWTEQDEVLSNVEVGS
jgi:hypothetical protein